MSFAPFKDRTITLTLESDYLKLQGDRAKNGAIKNFGTDFTNRFIPKSGLLGQLVQKVRKEPTLTLKGPTSISITHASTIAEAEGISTSFLQPWFIKNVNIMIRGNSYLGAFPILSVPDRDAEKLLKKYRDTLNDFSSNLGSPGSRERIILEFKGNPPGARKFIGFIKDLTFTEQIDSVYLIDYTMNFVGRNIDNSALAQGKGNAASSMRVNSGSGGGAGSSSTPGWRGSPT